MIDPTLYTRCRKARREGTFTTHLMAELLDACHRGLAATKLRTEPDAPRDVKLTALEWFIKEAKTRQATWARAQRKRHVK